MGMGGAVMLFSYINAWIIQPIEYPDPDRLVYLESLNKVSGVPHAFSPADFQDLRRQSKMVETMAGYDVVSKTLTGDHEPERVEIAAVSAEVFDMLGVKPFLGATFGKDQELPGSDGVMLISHGMWRHALAAMPESSAAK